jgi:DOPA 4,5-dioxygenase
VTLRQVITVDPVVGRSKMSAEGQLTNGHLVQIKRCDLGPGSFFLNIAGPPNSSASSWQCANMSIPDPKSSCQWSPFFPALPENSTYEGVVACPASHGISSPRSSCDKWTYWESNEKWAWWTVENQSIPVRLAKIIKDPAHPTWHLWHLEFENFQPGEPSVTAFAPPTGLGPCQPTPPRKTLNEDREMLPIRGAIASPMLSNQLDVDKSCKSTDVALQSYHIHVLFDAANASKVHEALQLQAEFMQAFNLIGKPNCTVVAGDPAPWITDICAFEIDWKPAGPFLTAQYSWFVPIEKLTKAVAWTLRHKGGLDVLVHPNSGCEVEDHTSWALWGGNRNPIDSSVFSCEYPGCVPPSSVL